MAIGVNELKAALKEMAKTNKALQSALSKSDDLALKSLVQAQNKLFSNIQTIINDMPDMSTLKLSKRLEWYVSQRTAINKAFAESGYTEIVEKYLSNYGAYEKLSTAVAESGTIASGFTELPGSVITSLQNQDFTQFEFLNLKAQNALRRQLYSSVISGRTSAKTLSELKSLITGEYTWGTRTGLYEWHSGTYFRTLHANASRAFMNEQAELHGIDKRLYIGPVDSKIRELCAELVGNIYTAAELADIDNGQTGNVLEGGGGWNCRHDPVPIGDEYADFASNNLSDEETEGLVNDAFKVDVGTVS